MKDVHKIKRLVDAIEEAHANIAPNYQEYLDIAFALVNELGEEGRPYFHRICALSPKYKSDEADKQYDECLRSSRHEHSISTVFHYAKRAGVKLSFTPDNPPTRTRVYNNVETHGEGEEREPELPTFPKYEWPRFLMECMASGDTDSKRDAVFLGCMTVLGATLGRFVSTPYSRKRIYPSLETFVLAPSTSGKGVLSPCRELAMPIHNEMYARYKQEMEDYRQRKSEWDSMGRERKNHPEPQEPLLKVFDIAANNSSTGIQEQLCNNNGIGLLADSEADTLSSAINADYGQWSHVLRKNFDHDRLSYNRRKDHEYRECEILSFGMLLSGTYGQITPLIPSAENGLFPRQVFYCLPPIDEWVDQFDDSGTDQRTLFRARGERWKKVIDNLRAQVDYITFTLTKEQQREFNELHARLFSHAVVTMGGEMRSQVARMATNVLRMMMVVAMVRSLDPWLTAESFEGNPLDSTLDPSRLTISGEDFRAVLALADPLYRHAAHVLTYIGKPQVERRKLSSLDELLGSLPSEFSRKDMVDKAGLWNIPENTVDTFLKRATAKGALEKMDRGVYRFTSRVRPSCARVGNDSPESLKERKEDEVW